MMEKYDSYKDSGLEWIGEIPSHWEVCRIRRVLDASKDGIKIGPFGSALTGKIGDNSLPYKIYGQWNIVDRDFTAGKSYIEEETYKTLSAYKVFPNDILISMMGTIGKCAVIPDSIQEGIMDSHVVKVRLDSTKIKSAFFQYIYDKDYSFVVYNNLLQEKKGSIMDGLNSSIIKDIFICIPPLQEQETIIAFLDAECSKIDSIISTQEKRIELLKELKQSIITKAVTKGLNPNAEMKDSGVEWIGRIPENWELCRIRRILDQSKDGIKIGPFGSALTGKVGDNSLPYKIYGQWNIVGCDFTAGKSFVDTDTFYALNAYKVIPNDILISMMGTIGKCAVIPDDIQDGIMDSHVVKIRLDGTKIKSAFFKYIYDKDCSSVIYNNLLQDKKGSIMDGLNSSIIKDLFICIPPLEEQERICSYLDTTCAEIDSMISSQEKQIALLKEYKQSLITEVVTGKRKVC